MNAQNKLYTNKKLFNSQLKYFFVTPALKV